MNEAKVRGFQALGVDGKNALCKSLMATTINALEARLRRLADIDEIKSLKACYAAACDNNYDADAIAELFTEDAIWDGGKFGRAEGREDIRRFFRRASQVFSFAIHHVMNPLIEVEGDYATGQWYLWQPATREPGGQAVWLAAVYRDDYVRVGGKWLFKHLRVNSNFLTTYEDGWAKKRFV
jgi:ketosteroid isomerase-like protein